MTLKLTGAQALVRALRIEGVRNVYGIVGGKLGAILHALGQEPQMRFIGVRHEAAAPMMAAACYAGTGNIAVALGEMGPGGLNMASGLGVGFANRLPLIAITTNQHRAASYPHSGMFMDLDTLSLTRPITVWNACVSDPRRVPELVRRAFHEALGGRAGPVHLDIPNDVLTESCVFADDEFELAPARYRYTGRLRADADSIARALDLLRSASRPLLVVGGGVVASGAEDAVLEVACRLNAPVVATQMGMGVVPSGSPHFVGHGGLIAGEPVRHAFERADVILSIGCRWSSWLWDERGPFARRSHRTISINTDASALGHPVVHEVAMQADARSALVDLLAGWDDRVNSSVAGDWLASNQAVRATYESRLQSMAAERGEVMHPAALAHAIGKALPSDALAVFDGGHTSFWSNDFTPVATTRTRFHEPGMSHLGFGLPWAIALQLEHPGRPVFHITGDGSFGFTLNELDTARRNRLPVITIVHNNAAWGVIRMGQKMALNFELGTALDETDYAAIARGFGCHGESVTRVEDVPAAIERAIASQLPAVLDCRTRFVPHPAMPLFGSMNRYGFEALTGTDPARAN